MEFRRPTLLVVHRDGPSVLITPTIDLNTAQAAARVDRFSAWIEDMGAEWLEHLPTLTDGAQSVGIEPNHMPPLVRTYLVDLIVTGQLTNVTLVLSKMRMIKSVKELDLARHAGQVANAMMAAGRAAIRDGVPEFEVSLATSQAATRKAPELLAAHYDDKDLSPNTHFLLIMASRETITKTHHRATTRIMRHGEPVSLCFCGMISFHRFKLGFDRTFWIGEITDSSQADVYAVALASQQAALDVVRLGVSGKSVHAAYAEVIQAAGHEYTFQCGRPTG